MTREEAITMLEQHIARLEIAQVMLSLIPTSKSGSSFKTQKKKPKNCSNESRQVTKQPFKKSLTS
jgi:hypothetical protein